MNDDQHETAPIEAGTPVEVRTRFARNWSIGFEVASVGADGLRLRRVSDRAILPVPFPRGDVRPRYPR